MEKLAADLIATSVADFCAAGLASPRDSSGKEEFKEAHDRLRVVNTKGLDSECLNRTRTSERGFPSLLSLVARPSHGSIRPSVRPSGAAWRLSLHSSKLQCPYSNNHSDRRAPEALIAPN